VQAADLVNLGRATEWTQDEKEATYEGWVREAEARINWASHVDFVYDLIRGCNPAPGAWTTIKAPEGKAPEGKTPEDKADEGKAPGGKAPEGKADASKAEKADRKLYLFDAKKIMAPTFGAVRGKKLGEVVSAGPEGLRIHAQGGFIEVSRLRLGDGAKVKSTELDIPVGTILGG